MKKVILSLAVLLTLHLGAARGADAKTTLPERKPNILVIVIDDMGWSDAGCLGGDFYQTPNIDRLRREGMYFPRTYMTGPICAPSRVSLIFGKYPARYDILEVPGSANGRTAEMRMTKLIPPYCKTDVPVTEPSIATALRTAGYYTVAIGKWHAGGSEMNGPLEHGFDQRICKDGWQPPGDEKQINWLTDQTIGFLKQHKDDSKPFFVYLAHYAVHHFYYAPQALIDKYQKLVRPGLTHYNAIYAANLEFLDDAIGRLMASLKDLGLSKNTVVFFTSDNGGRVGNVNFMKATSNDPLRNGKHSLYEGGLRVPFLARWPGVIKANSTCKVPIIGNDFFPTALQLAGAKTPFTTDGVSIVPLLTGHDSAFARKETNFYWYYPYYIHGPLYGAFTYSEEVHPSAAVLQGKYKLIDQFESPELAELYDVVDDPSEKTNLALAMPDKVKELRAQLTQWLHDVKTTLPKPNPHFDPRFEGSVMAPNGAKPSDS